MPRPLRVGVQLPEVERDVRWPEYVAMARAAEEVGLDSIWLGDHLLYRGDGGPERGPWEVWTMLAGLAAVTERVQLGPLVACTGFHRPAMLAKLAATVDEIAGGRLVLGLGSGWNEPDFRAFGNPFDHRVSRFEEEVPIIRDLLAGQRVTFHGRYHQIEDAVLLPPPARRPPLMAGVTGPRALAATLPFVESWNCWYDWYGNDPARFATLGTTIDEAARAVGRDPATLERSACVLVTIGPPGAGERPHSAETPGVAADPEVLARHLRALAAAGADEAILVPSPNTEAAIRTLAPALALLDS